MPKIERMFLATDAGDPLNGTVWTDADEMLDAVSEQFGRKCHFGIIDGTIVDADEKDVATYGSL